MTAQQINKNLFTDVEGFEEYDKIVKEKESKKRGPYKFKAFKPTVLSVYQQMDNLYVQLANYLPQPLFCDEEAVFTYDDVKVWYMVYTDEDYEHENEIFTGEPFKIYCAEIIGTENLPIEKRIEVHQELLNILSDGVQLKEAVSIIQPKIKALQPVKQELDRRMI